MVPPRWINLDKGTYHQNNMSVDQILIVKPDLTSASAPSSDSNVTIQLNQIQSDIVEFDKTNNVNLANVFDSERQKSVTFRPIIKLSYIYDNNIQGYCPTPPYGNYQNSLYYTNPQQSIFTGQWTGLPSYQEFEFIRTDINNPQLRGTQFGGFVTQSASTYNWSLRISYPFENLYNVPMSYSFPDGSQISWLSGDGIPFQITQGTDNGLPNLQFICPMKHGLSVSDYVLLSPTFNYNGSNIFQVDSLGNNTYGSDEYIFNLDNIGYTGTTFYTGAVGTFKKITDVLNSGETISEYYIRHHKIITTDTDTILTKNGFESNLFPDKTFYQLSGLTPNKTASVVKYQSASSYNVTFQRDIELRDILDNNKKPLTQLFATIQWVGYYGWHNKLQRGWDFNVGSTSNWYSRPNTLGTEDVSTVTYTQINRGNLTPLTSYTFLVNLPKNSGDTYYGDFCEYNQYEQLERVISFYTHKITYNQSLFTTDTTTNQLMPKGYFYQVHHPITLKVFSDYIETASNDNVNIVPNYSFFSTNQNMWMWRDLYPYGFIDDGGRGVNYPFMNETHYPFTNIIFKLFNNETSFNILDYYQITIEPLIDSCE